MTVMIKPANAMNQSASSLLSLLHFSSPALPVGAFAYSQGLEYALDAGWCKNANDIEEWIKTNLRYGMGTLDLPIYIRLYSAWVHQNTGEIKKWNQELLAFRETKELYLEDTQVGSAFLQWHKGQIEKPNPKRESLLEILETPTLVAMNSLAAVFNEVPLESAMIGFIWSWAENQIACASKALPLGQTAGQQILKRLIPDMEKSVFNAISIEDADIGSSLFGVAMASSLHEQQYSRLFRS